MKISVITPVYNPDDTIFRCIKSVESQGFNEHIMVWKGDSKYIDLVTNQYPEITIYRGDYDIYQAMNYGIENASGDYIGVLPSNDYYDQNAYSILCKSLDDNKKLYYGLCKYYDNDTLVGIGTSANHGILKGSVPHPTLFVPREIYEEYGLYRTDYKYCSDYEFVLRLYIGGVEFRLIESVIAHYGFGGASSTLKARLETLRLKFEYRKYIYKPIAK